VEEDGKPVAGLGLAPVELLVEVSEELAVVFERQVRGQFDPSRVEGDALVDSEHYFQPQQEVGESVEY